MRTLVTILFFLSIVQLYAQEPKLINFSVKEGLPSSDVYHVQIDKDGYVWFATDNGVSKFDGYEFKNFGLEDGLLDLTVFEIYRDYEDKLWFIPFSNQLTYYSNKKINPYKYNSKIIDSLKYGSAPVKQGFYVSKNGTIFLSDFNNGLITIDSIGHLYITSHLQNYLYKYFLIDSTFLIYSKTKLAYKMAYVKEEYLKHWGKIEPVNLYVKNDSLIFNLPRSVALYKNQKYYTSIQNVLVISEKKNQQEIKDIGSEIVWLSFDNKHNLWVGTINKGAFCFKNGEIDTKPIYHLLKNETVTSVCQGSNNEYWFTTLDNGVYFSPDLNIKTYNMKNSGLQSNRIQSIDFAKDTLWIGFQEPSIAYINSNEVHSLNIKQEPSEILKYIFKIKKELIIGTTKKTFLYNKGKIKFIYYKNNPKLNSISIYKIDSNSYFLGKSYGFVIADINMIRTEFNSIDQYNFTERTMSCIASINSNDLYIGTLKGLYKFNYKEFVYLGNQSYLFKERCNVLEFSKFLDFYIIGTKGIGIVLFNDTLTYNINKEAGLISNDISDIFIEDNTLWVSTNLGLSKVVFDNKYSDYKIYNFTENDGLATNEINAIEIADSIIYLATNEGLTFFKKSDFNSSKPSPKIIIEKVEINGIDTLVYDSYELPYFKNSISIYYKGIDFKQRNNISYKYRLLGNQNRWYFTKNTQVQFLSLQPGNYVFEVLASNENNEWNEKPTQIKFTINKPFWKTIWFNLLLVIFIILIAYFVTNWRINAIRKRNKLERDLVRTRQKALSSQMNPHFIFNSLNSIQNFILKNDKLSSNLYLSKFAELMRRVLNNSQLSFITIEEEINALLNYIELEALRFKGKFEYKILIDDNINANQWKIPPLILQPYVENAIWHGIMHSDKPGQVIIEMKLLENIIKCSITDNGIGRKKSAEINANKQKTYQSFGSNITKQRLALINTMTSMSLEVKYIDLLENNIPLGTKVIIKFPIIH